MKKPTAEGPTREELCRAAGISGAMFDKIAAVAGVPNPDAGRPLSTRAVNSPAYGRAGKSKRRTKR